MKKTNVNKLKVGTKVKIMDVDSIVDGEYFWENGDVVEVKMIKGNGEGTEYYLETSKKDNLSDASYAYLFGEEVNAVKIVKKNKKKKEIEELKKRIENLELMINARDSECSVSDAPEKEKVLFFEEELAEKEKTKNELRKEIIEKAKLFIDLEKHKDKEGYIRVVDSLDSGYSPWFVKKISFKYSYKKKSVALRAHGYAGDVVDSYVVKCHPEDVFNVDIGKAIALGRALGLDVSEFENAVQPDEIVVGHYAESKIGDYALVVKEISGSGLYAYREDGAYALINDLKISGDTHAKY